MGSMNRDRVQTLLPACQRCRRLRRKCDTLLPRCRPCENGGHECTFLDSALQQVIQRSHVQSLLDRLDQLRAIEQGPIITESSTSSRATKPSAPSCFDVIIGSPYSVDTSRYMGSSSVYALAVELIQHSVINGLITTNDADLDSEKRTDNQINQEPKDDDDLSHRLMTCALPSDVQSLVSLYMTSFNAVYGFADERTVSVDLEAYLTIRSRPSLLIHSLKGIEAHQFFRTSLICAISCANEARHKPSRAAESLVYYREALECIEEVTSEVSSASLRALLLLILYVLFQPSKGDIWKLLDNACRLMIELDWHTETSRNDTEPDEYQIRSKTFYGLYALESIVCELFGRNSSLQCRTITSEYPNSVVDVDATIMAHHYRLVSLRSEIYRTMYLPVQLPGYVATLPWLREKYIALDAWHQQITWTDPFSSLGAMKCHQGYKQTLCLLFRPLLLQALRRTQQNTEENGDRILVVADSYWAACDLIKTYDSLLRAPKSSFLGAYPITFLSAQHIWLATSTLLAHAALALTGRVTTLKRLCDWPEGDTIEVQENNDYASTFAHISPTCSKLLHWCVERWPGMRSLLDIYDKLILRLTRECILSIR